MIEEDDVENDDDYEDDNEDDAGTIEPLDEIDGDDTADDVRAIVTVLQLFSFGSFLLNVV